MTFTSIAIVQMKVGVSELLVKWQNGMEDSEIVVRNCENKIRLNKKN